MPLPPNPPPILPYARPTSLGPPPYSRLAILGLLCTLLLSPLMAALTISPTGPLDWIDDHLPRAVVLTLAALLVLGPPLTGAVLGALALLQTVQRQRRGMTVALLGLALGLLSCWAAAKLMLMIARY